MLKVVSNSPSALEFNDAYILAATASEEISTTPLDSPGNISSTDEPEYTSSGKLIHRTPFTIDETGHYVGEDGFVVPANFEEFYQRFPRYLRDFARQHMSRSDKADLEDRESELALHLMTIPADSKFREPGYNGHAEGCQDRIQIFNPNKQYGACWTNFRSFLHYCLINHFYSLIKKAASNPVRRYNTLSLYSPDAEGNLIDEEYLYTLSSNMALRGPDYDEIITNGLFVGEFVDYVREHNPEYVAVAYAFASCDTFIDAQRELGMPDNLFTRARNRLIYLHSCFDAGVTPVRQRKVYRPRVPANGTQVRANLALAI